MKSPDTWARLIFKIYERERLRFPDIVTKLPPHTLGFLSIAMEEILPQIREETTRLYRKKP